MGGKVVEEEDFLEVLLSHNYACNSTASAIAEVQFSTCRLSRQLGYEKCLGPGAQQPVLLGYLHAWLV